MIFQGAHSVLQYTRSERVEILMGTPLHCGPKYLAASTTVPRQRGQESSLHPKTNNSFPPTLEAIALREAIHIISTCPSL